MVFPFPKGYLNFDKYLAKINNVSKYINIKQVSTK